MTLLKFKRDLVTFYMLAKFTKFYLQKKVPSYVSMIAHIEHLESHISFAVSSLLFRLVKRKYDVTESMKSDPFVVSFMNRFTQSSGRNFYQNNVVVLKPFISTQEKGIILLKYSEVINAFPFIFDLAKVQERYHLVLEPSTESPFQLYNHFIKTNSLVFVQSLSNRERKLHERQGFIPVSLCAGDWVNERNFSYSPAERIYDFCTIGNFIPVKRYPFLLASLSKYWTGDLRFAIIASVHVGFKRPWIDNLLKEYGLDGKADILMDIPSQSVNHILNQSGCHVLGSEREGANKASFESIIAGTPAVVPANHIGFPNWKFREPLVFNYSDGESLVAAIKRSATVDKRQAATLALSITGSARATQVLNAEMKQAALAAGEGWTTDILEKVNNVQAFYKHPADALKCTADYEFLEQAATAKNCYSAAGAIKILSAE